MTNYRLYPTNPTLGTGSYSGTFEAGISFMTTAYSWFEGYWFCVPAGGATATQTFCLYNYTASMTGVVVPNSTVTSAATPLIAGQWNYIPLPTPIPLAVGAPYMAATGFTAVGSFAVNNNQFNTGGPFVSGITQGPLFAFSDSTAGGTAGTTDAWAAINGTFATTTTDPTAHMPTGSSNSANFGIDVQISDTAPVSFTGPWSGYPSTSAARPGATADSAVPYGVAVEGQCNTACTVTALRVYSISGATVLPSWVGIWDVGTQTIVEENLSPSWSGVAGSGWVQTALPTARLTPGHRYRFHVNVTTNSVATAKDAADPWGTGRLKNGIAAGPITFVSLANASSAYNYNNNAGGTPPYSDGTVVSHAQSIFSQTATGYSGRPPYPLLWANGGGGGSGTQDYFVDAVYYTASGNGALLAATII